MGAAACGGASRGPARLRQHRRLHAGRQPRGLGRRGPRRLRALRGAAAGDGGRPRRAALVNGLSSSQHAYNDTHLATVAHPSGPTLAPLLALAERQAMTGAELLAALVLGIEVQCRVGLMLVTPPANAAVGLSTQGV